MTKTHKYKNLNFKKNVKQKNTRYFKDGSETSVKLIFEKCEYCCCKVWKSNHYSFKDFIKYNYIINNRALNSIYNIIKINLLTVICIKIKNNKITHAYILSLSFL